VSIKLSLLSFSLSVVHCQNCVSYATTFKGESIVETAERSYPFLSHVCLTFSIIESTLLSYYFVSFSNTHSNMIRSSGKP